MSKFRPLFSCVSILSAIPSISRYSRLLALTAILSGLSSQPVQAANDWSMCQAPLIHYNPPADTSLTQILSDSLISEDGKLYRFEGQVEVRNRNQSLFADHLQLDRPERLFSASGDIRFSDSLLSLSAGQVELDDNRQTARFEQTEFTLFDNHLRGSATKILQLNSDQSELFDVSYTTCDPGQNTWSLHASRLLLDQQDGRATAHHAVLRLKDVPVLYLPWMQFPIDDRRMSGLLNPTLSHSQRAGYQLNLPLYWDIAGNTDMTITPVFFSLRGTQFNTENRYLLGNSERPHSGQLELSWLDDQVSGSERWFRRWTHQSRLGEHTRASILLQKMSDSQFANDFQYLTQTLDAKLDSASKDVDFLRSAIRLDSTLGGWNSKLLFDQYQTLNQAKAISSRPYKRLPSLDINRQFRFTDSNFRIDWKNQWTRFEREQSLTGQRLHITPTLSYPIEQSGYFLKPALQTDMIQYRLQETDGSERSEQLALPLLSIDSGLIFERIASRDRHWFQTFEPRLYLLQVPYQDQSALPDFDTSLVSENYASLFQNNRFSGGDRIGDSRQASLALTTRILDKDRRELFSASLGQAFYAEPRRVSLDNSIDERKKSSLMALISAQPGSSWNLQLSSVFDQQARQAIQNDFTMRFRNQGRVMNLEYHFRRDKLEQSNISLVYPLSPQWGLFAKRQYSIKNQLPVQNLFGLAFESCCWGFKVLYEDSTDDNFENRDQTLYLQLTLKGLSSAGKDINSQLENAILGYQPVF